jgi:electron transfer flavoprotein alpha subunit
MSPGILLFIEHRDGTPARTSLEAAAAAQLIAAAAGEKVSAVVLGNGLDDVAANIAGKLVETVYKVEDERLTEYTPDGYVGALRQVVAKLDPKLVLFSHTYQVRDFAPRLAAALEKPLVCDCVGWRMDGSDLILVRQLFQGKISSDVRVAGGGALVTFQAGAYRADQATAGTSPAPVKVLEIDMASVTIRSQPHEKFQEAKQAVDLTQAELIVAVGRGIKSQENITLVEDLAKALGAEIAASRPICDNEWLPMDRQIGSSGQTVTPKLYLAVGISGAIQHVVGMKNSQTIVAINKDGEAPIFDIADYGIVGDLFEIVPALTAEIKKAKEQG